MILKKLRLFNFRQFRGEQQLEFAHESGNCNVTVVFGENGRGKTGLFRAVVFCLFGERRLSQDGNVPDSELQLVNVSALEQSDSKPVEMYVELEFSHKNNNYLLKRSMRAMREGAKTLEEDNDLRLVETPPDGNSKIIEPADVDRLINSILDRRVKDYFLFDGEKIERLTRAALEQRREISKGIRNLLNIDALETARKATERLTRNLEDELRKNASPELARLLKQLSDNEELQKQGKQRLDEIGDEATLAKDEMTKVDKELESIREIRSALEKRKDLERLLDEQEQRSKELLTGMKGLASRAAVLLIAPTLQQVFEHIEKQKQKGEIPSEIRKDLIEKILSEKRCICGNEIRKGTTAYALILEWKNRTSDVVIQDTALNLWRYLSEIKGRLEDDATQIENQLINHGTARSEIEATRMRLEKVCQEIGSSARPDAAELEKHRQLIQNKIIKLEVESQGITQQIQNREREHDQFTAQLKEEKLKSDRQDELSLRASLARDTRDALTTIYEDFTKEIKVLIGTKATELFHQLLDREGRENLRAIVVRDDYSLQVHDRWGRPFLANISAGQRQIMSISFIGALAQLASRKPILEMPLFMDTPFGRLSYEHRQNLIKQIPEFASQWILLATDTEFRKPEAKLLKASERWGAFFMLRPTEDGNTRIEEYAVGTVQAMLRDEEAV